MRRQILKMQRGHSTRAERRFMELLKARRIKFRAKRIVCGREVDFLIGKYAIDIDGHQQDGDKNELLAKSGYVPVHYLNHEITNSLDIEYLCQ